MNSGAQRVKTPVVYLVCGLGNPGPQYEGNRHNIGFMTVDALADRWKAPLFREKFRGVFTKVDVRDESVVLLKPHTYMNLSGESVQAAMSFFKIPVERLIVVHDELDVPLGEFRVKLGGGSAGHNGLKSITQHLSAEYVRLRLGVSRPQGMRPDRWVLSDFSADDLVVVEQVVEKACRAVQTVLKDGPQVAMNRHNQRPKKPKSPKNKKKPELETGPEAQVPTSKPPLLGEGEESC